MIGIAERLRRLNSWQLGAALLLIVCSRTDTSPASKVQLRQAQRVAAQAQPRPDRLAIPSCIYIDCHRLLPYAALPWGQPKSGLLTSSPVVNNPYSVMTKIATVNDAVRALGGTGKTARLLSVGDAAVSNMLARGEFPKGHHLTIYLALRARGEAVDEYALFGLDPGRDLGNRAAA
jgi:hypothetical protein